LFEKAEVSTGKGDDRALHFFKWEFS